MSCSTLALEANFLQHIFPSPEALSCLEAMSPNVDVIIICMSIFTVQIIKLSSKNYVLMFFRIKDLRRPTTRGRTIIRTAHNTEDVAHLLKITELQRG